MPRNVLQALFRTAIVFRAIAAGKQVFHALDEGEAADNMTRELVTVTPEMTMEDLPALMEQNTSFTCS